MGFNQSLGEHIMRRTVAEYRPTSLVVLRSRSARKNYSVDFDRLLRPLSENCNLLTFSAMPESDDVQVSYNVSRN